MLQFQAEITDEFVFFQKLLQFQQDDEQQWYLYVIQEVNIADECWWVA